MRWTIKSIRKMFKVRISIWNISKYLCTDYLQLTAIHSYFKLHYINTKLVKIFNLMFEAAKFNKGVVNVKDLDMSLVKRDESLNVRPRNRILNSIISATKHIST